MVALYRIFGATVAAFEFFGVQVTFFGIILDGDQGSNSLGATFS